MRRFLETDAPGQACQAWRVPECPFPIEWSAAVMEEIRMAAVEGLFAVPHGGAEVGGVLFGTHSGGCVRILAARPLDCEHLLGPTFTLSGNDLARLAAMLHDGLQDGRDGWDLVGWYHSHTRSEIFLSAQDLKIHNRYFPDPWHVALVVRPHAMHPMRAGFFFREADGSIHAESSYSEFAVQPASQAVQAAVAQPAPQAVQAVVAQAVSPAKASEARPAPRAKHSRNWLWWAMIVLAMAEVLFVFKSGVLERDWTRVFAADRARSVSLMAYDLNSQLQIHWDWAADPIRSAEAGTLEITDGAAHTVVALEKQRLRSGTVAYARIGARVDVRLALRQPGGKIFEEFTTFLGPAGGPQPDASLAALRRKLQDQAVRTGQLESAVAGLRGTIRREQEPRRQDSPR
jgi:proteasome lid subunit RPN8/RPN11